jgi:hypothetical protein
VNVAFGSAIGVTPEDAISAWPVDVSMKGAGTVVDPGVHAEL